MGAFVYDSEHQWLEKARDVPKRTFCAEEPKRAERQYFEHRGEWDKHIASLPEEQADSVRRALRLPARDPVAEAVKRKVARHVEGQRMGRGGRPI